MQATSPRRRLWSGLACAIGWLSGAAAATIMWFVAAGGDTVFNAAVLAAGAILMAFSAPLPRKADAAARSS